LGIIACVQVTTTTAGTTPISTPTPFAPTPTTSGTTVLPTSVQTTPICQKNMAQVGGVYVSSVDYSAPLLPGTNPTDLTSTTGNGVSFQSVPNTTGLFDQSNNPLYSIMLTFNPAGVNSLSSIIVNSGSNVNQFSVEFFDLSNPTVPIASSTPPGDIPLSSNSILSNSLPSLLNFPADLPSLSGIQISILSTTDNQ
jgi:hypothetical protein